MPCDYKNYPKNWKAIRQEILQRARHQCECLGECGKYHGTGSLKGKVGYMIGDRCQERHYETPKTFSGFRVVLTVAHLNHKTKDSRRSNLKAFCQACHLRYDREQHKKTRRVNLENAE